MPAVRSTASRKAEAEIATRPINVRPINGFIGAEIEGIDLRQPLSPAQFKIVHDALVQYEVIVMRDQDITVDQQMAFGALFGELSIHPFSPNLADKPEVIILDYSKDNPPALTDIWHADETFREAPPLGTILRAKVVPEVGGDTLFSSMSAAYRGLSERMKQHIHGMEALHDFSLRRPLFSHNDRAKLRKLEDEFPNSLASRGAGAPGLGPAHPLCEPAVLRAHQGSQDRRERHAAGLPLPAGHHPRVPAQGEVEAQHAGDVGQPLRAALCRARLLSGAAHHGTRDGEGRPPGRRQRRLCARCGRGQRHGETTRSPRARGRDPNAPSTVTDAKSINREENVARLLCAAWRSLRTAAHGNFGDFIQY